MRRHGGRVLPALGLAAVLAAATALTAVPAQAADPDCAAFGTPIHQTLRADNASLLTASDTEVDGAIRYGFGDASVEFKAASQSDEGLVAAHRLYSATRRDFLTTSNPTEIANAVARAGYVDQGTRFYVSDSPADCLVPVYRFSKANRHRHVATEVERSALAAAGWTAEGIAFYAAAAETQPQTGPAPAPDPAPGDTTFTFAQFPDTQQEVLKTNDTRFINRTRWLVAQRTAMDLRFMASTGDNVNWDTPDHSQYEIASAALLPLEQAGIPYQLAIGNHDTQATGPGGSARQSPISTHDLQRDTSTFNRYFTAARYGGVDGAYEPGKVDNVYSLYEAGGVTWMMLTLELWPRKGAVDWAKSVVAAHPDANVIVATHDYLEPDGSIGATNGGYGDTSPQYLYDQLISQYANIRIVMSGHVGIAGSRTDTGRHGNQIYTFATTFHSATTNPIRMFEIDTATGSLRTWIYAPYTDQEWPEYARTFTAVRWVR